VSPFVEAYIAFLETLLIMLVPLLGLLTIYAWWFAVKVHRAWAAGDHAEPRPRLPLAIAIKDTVALVAAATLAWSVLWRSRIGPLPEEALPWIATSTLVLMVGCYASTLYIIVVEISSALRRD